MVSKWWNNPITTNMTRIRNEGRNIGIVALGDHHQSWHTIVYLVGGWGTPLINMSSSIGMMTFPIYGKIKNGNQTTNQVCKYKYIYIHIIIYTRHVIKQSTVHYDILRLSMSVQGISNRQLLYIIKPDILRPYGGFLSHGGSPNVSYHPYGFSQ